MFSENQSRQLYVLSDTQNDVKQPVVTDSDHSASIDATTTAAGSIQFVRQGGSDEAYFLYKGPSKDGLQRSDLIKRCNVISVSLSDAGDMKHIKKRQEITLSGAPVAGQEYILNIFISNYIANGTGSTKVKFGVAIAENTTASDLYKKLAINLAKNLAREPYPLLKIMLKNSSTPVEVLPKYKVTSTQLNVTATGIILEEVEQPWRRGAAAQEFVDFDAKPSTIFVNNVDQVWGTVSDVTASNTSNFIPNSKKVADMEYFYHKNRGDIYGEAGFPDNIDTTYMVNEENSSGYSMVDIHFYYEGNSHNIGHSEKTITLVGTKAQLKRAIGSARVTGTNAAEPTGLYAFLEGTNAVITKSSSAWDS